MGNIVTRFPNGATNVAEDTPWGDFPAFSPSKAHTYFNDFDTYTAADWTVTETQAGATQALADGDGGLLLLTNSAADDDIVSLQKVGESFLFASGKKLWFEGRFKVSDATQSDFVIGLLITDTTPLDVTDGVYFSKADGSTALSFSVEKNNTATSATSIATVANNTFLKVAFFFDGESYVYYYINDVMTGKVAITNLPDDEDLTVSFAIQNGEAAAKTMTVDYVFAAKER